ncbi:methanogen output domain 1-containing protein [Rubrimonas cliftonensis]|uniref:Metanogen output domain-containing protein n=1 Tax=Rubrimonas cliftonensis TaxID=89524 RepID=A0A1H3YK36_9RHOB|nr:methanogen output domain 1-containing protein [Rubrimonas cliftonensis]SEA11895.1 hypothetical protein SAMN05444370_103134 [Rubrimonas cliftonensis]
MENTHFDDFAIALDRDSFLRDLLRDLSGALSRIVGDEEAAGYISLVGAAMGRRLLARYRDAAGRKAFTPDEVARILVDLKARIDGGFRIAEVSEDQIVLTNSACPFAGQVAGRPVLCMMTSNVFGYITAQSLGYARVEIREAFARGDDRCHVVIHLKPRPGPGRAYVSEEQ